MKLKEVAADNPLLSDCQKAYFSEISERFGVAFDPYAGERDEADDARQWHVLAVENDDTLGCGSLRDIGDGVAEVKRVWISKAAREKGAATAIMDWLEAKAIAEGFTAIRLDTNRTLNEAQALYRKRGYLAIERYNANPFADQFFELLLVGTTAQDSP